MVKFQVKSATSAVARTIAVAALATAPISAAGAATYSSTLQTGSLPAGLTVGASDPAYSAAFTPQGLVMSRPSGTPNGGIEVTSSFTFSGAYSLSVDMAFATTGLSGLAESGLLVASGGSFSDVFYFDNEGFGRINNHLGATSLTSTTIGDDLRRLNITGNTLGAPFVLDLFLLQEYGGTSANSVTFSNLVLNADTISLAGGVPEPSAWALLILGFGVVGAGMRARRNGLAQGPRPAVSLG